MYSIITLKAGREKNLLQGHPWIFSQAIDRYDDKLQLGDLCAIHDSAKNFLAIGFFNPNTDIAVRVVTRKAQVLDAKFFQQRLADLKEQKEEFLPADTDSYRLVFAESDNLPGLIIDKYANTLVLQFHILGMERFRNEIVETLKNIFPEIGCIYLKPSRNVSGLEGELQRSAEVLYGTLPEDLVISENGLSFKVDLLTGQKTGFFLDQRQNREAITLYTKGRKVLNCFSYTGSFSVYAATKGSAKFVCSVDVSEPAIRLAEENFAINKLDANEHKFLVQDVFDHLNEIKPSEYDLIIIDPPSMARKRNQVKQAIKAYTSLNTKALNKLPENGILVTSSCTTHIDELTFIKIIHQSAVNAGCQLKVLHSATQPHDHPYNLSFPEGKYLKFYILQKSKVS